MFQGFLDEAFEFFMAIRFNNNVEFFHENHDWYLRAVREPCLALADALSETIETLDSDAERRPNRVVSRINRDVRFSRDKSPYRDHIWLAFKRPGGLLESLPTYYFDIGAEGVCCGMGFYEENRPMMNGLRQSLMTAPERFLECLSPIGQDFKLYRNSFKRMKIPESLPPELAEWYPVRSFGYEKPITDLNLIRSAALADCVAECFNRLSPLYHFLGGLQRVSDKDETRQDTVRAYPPDRKELYGH